MSLLIAAGKLSLGLLYRCMRLLPVKNQICMLSRESDGVPLDFQLLKKALTARDKSLEIVEVCELVDSENAPKTRILRNTLRCMWALSRSKSCVVDTYCLPLSVFSQREELTAVQIWHALGAVKKFGYQCLDSEGGRDKKTAQTLEMHKNYTFVTCASKATKDIYAEAFHIEPQRVRVLGMPRLDYLVRDSAAKRRAAEGLLQKYPTLKTKKTVLYAPTFRDGGGMKLDEILDTVDFDKYNVVIKPHILTRDKPFDPRLLTVSENIWDLFSLADFVVTDYSAACFEAAAAGKKLLFYVYDIEEYEKNRGLNLNPLMAYPALSSKSFLELYALMESGRYPEETLFAFRDKYIETADGKCCERIAEALLSG